MTDTTERKTYAQTVAELTTRSAALADVIRDTKRERTDMEDLFISLGRKMGREWTFLQERLDRGKEDPRSLFDWSSRSVREGAAKVDAYLELMQYIKHQLWSEDGYYLQLSATDHQNLLVHLRKRWMDAILTECSDNSDEFRNTRRAVFADVVRDLQYV